MTTVKRASCHRLAFPLPAPRSRSPCRTRRRRVRTPEFAAPNLRARNNRVTVEADVGPTASGVLYALGGIAGGITLYLEGGVLSYEYNTFQLWRSKLRSSGTSLAPGSAVRIVVETTMSSADRAAPAEVVLRVDGEEVARGTVEVTAPLGFTATETLDIGTDLGSPVSLDYVDRAPFAFDGTVHSVHVEYVD